MSSIKIAGIATVVLLAAGLVAMVRHGRVLPAETSTFTFEPETMKDFKKPEAAELKKKTDLRAIRSHATVWHGTGVPQCVLGQS